MAIVIHFMPEWHVLIIIAVGGAVYGALGLASGAWHPRDIRYLRRV
jgi:hypothetical protein